MNYKSIFLLGIMILTVNVFSQEKQATKPAEVHKVTSKPILRVFANYHSNLKEISVMEIQRAYLGYTQSLSPNYSMKITMDVGADNGKYRAFLKTAALKYHKEKWTVQLGIIATTQFKEQEGFWGYRYLQKSFQDIYKYNGSADLGVSVKYKVLKNLSIDAIVQNGEGYSHIEPTGTYRNGWGITYQPIKSITTRLYSDFSYKPQITRQNFAAMIGYKYKKKFRIAVEYNYQKNHHFENHHDMGGFSAYSTFVLNEKIELFARYDQSTASTTGGIPWKLGLYENVALVGLQYSPVKNIHCSLNYRRMDNYASIADYANKNTQTENMIFLNFEYRFK